MKIAAMTLMAAIVGVAAEPRSAKQKLTVYMRDNATVPPEVRAPALDLANKMFATIGDSETQTTRS
jgi:expansin (peptidoglycan-binding protein)